MTQVEIEYCVPCGLYENAANVQEELLDEFGEGLDRVSLVTGDGGVFKIRVENDLVYDSDKHGELDLSELKEEVKGRIPA